MSAVLSVTTLAFGRTVSQTDSRIIVLGVIPTCEEKRLSAFSFLLIRQRKNKSAHGCCVLSAASSSTFSLSPSLSAWKGNCVWVCTPTGQADSEEIPITPRKVDRVDAFVDPSEWRMWFRSDQKARLRQHTLFCPFFLLLNGFSYECTGAFVFLWFYTVNELYADAGIIWWIGPVGILCIMNWVLHFIFGFYK